MIRMTPMEHYQEAEDGLESGGDVKRAAVHAQLATAGALMLIAQYPAGTPPTVNAKINAALGPGEPQVSYPRVPMSPRRASEDTAHYHGYCTGRKEAFLRNVQYWFYEDLAALRWATRGEG